MRHGRVPANEEHRYAGALDEPLSEAGERDARAAGTHPGVSRVYVSPKLRARQTARICFPNAGQVVVDGLAEMDFGDFEGRSADDMYGNDAAYTAWVEGRCLGTCPNGESRGSFTRRVADALAALLRAARDRGEERVIVVAHGGTVMAAMYSFAKGSDRADPDSYYTWHVGNCGGYRARVSFVGDVPCFAEYEPFEDLSFLL